MVECAKKLVPGAGWRTGTEALQARAKDIIRIKVPLTIYACFWGFVN